MRFSIVTLGLLSLISLVAARPQGYEASAPTKTTSSSGSSAGPQADPERRAAVLEAFKYNYGKYEQYAFGSDVLNVIKKQGDVDGAVRDFAGTIIDALDTMIVMGMGESDQYKRALGVVKNLTFDNSNQKGDSDDPEGVVKVFEWTIRLVGGLLSAYQRNGEKPEERFLVEKAQHIANKLSVAWVGNNKIPFGKVNINNDTVYHEPGKRKLVVVAEPGTLDMEWDMLSRYTKNDTYRKLTVGAVEAILGSKPVFPGIWDEGIYPDNATAALDYVTLGGGYDSFFEYLIKYPVLIGAGPDHPFVKAWEQGMNSIESHLLRKTSVKNYTFLSDYSIKKQTPITVFSHLACFIGGNIAYGGRLLKNDHWTQIGLEISESCAATYFNTVSGIAPFGWGYANKDGVFEGWPFVSASRREFYSKHGFFSSLAVGGQAPEVLESLFYSYRITGNKRFQDLAFGIFQNMKKSTDSGNGWSSLENVNDASTDLLPTQATYLYAEVFKYMYLIFDDPDRVSLDKHVFNTEAHVYNRMGGQWGKVQGTFPYEFIVSDNSSESSVRPSPTPTTKQPEHFVEADPHSGLQGMAEAMAGQLGIDTRPAAAMFSPLPNLQAKK